MAPRVGIRKWPIPDLRSECSEVCLLKVTPTARCERAKAAFDPKQTSRAAVGKAVLSLPVKLHARLAAWRVGGAGQ